MITAEDFVLELNSSEESKNFKLANVVGLFENKTAKIQFDGEDTPSEKQYAYLESYTPKVFDRVLLGVLGGTYVILGKVNYNISPPTEELDRYLFDLKLVTMQKGLSATGPTTLNSGATIVGNVGIDGNVNAIGISATGNISGNGITAVGDVVGGNIKTAGELSAGTLKLATAVTSWTVNGNSATNGFHQVKGILYADDSFLHRGRYLSFFNKNTNVQQQRVYNDTTGTLSSLQTTLNNLLNALKMYGLIS